MSQFFEKDSSRELAKTLVIAVALAMVFRSLFFQPFHIPSGSMKSTLLKGDYIFVSKYAYGYSHYSFPFSLPLFKGRIFGSEPQRGDVVVFRLPRDTDIDYIKRVIGLPGDKIQVRDSVLYINDKEVKRKRIEDFVDNDNEELLHRIPRYIETLPNGVQYTVLDQRHSGEVDNTQVYTVPEGHYFMMGDNRDNSVDSRYNKDYGFPEREHVGFIPAENLVGRAEIILLSFKGFTALRWDRFVHSITYHAK